MDTFKKRYWSRLQATVFLSCKGKKEAVQLAAHDPGTTIFMDLSLGPDGWDDEALDIDKNCVCARKEDLILEFIERGYLESLEVFEAAEMELDFAKQGGQLHVYLQGDREFFKREEVLRLRPSYAKAEPHVSELNKSGRPPFPYKEAAVKKTLEWIDEEDELSLKRIRQFMADFVAGVDESGGPSERTLKSWAREALDKHHKRCRDGRRYIK